MLVNVLTINENEDGSANCVVQLDEESITELLRFGLIKSIEDAIELAKKEYAPQPKDDRQMEFDFNE